MSTLQPNLSGGAPAPTHADFNALRKFATENAITSGAPGLRRRAFGGGSLITPIHQTRRRTAPPTVRTFFTTDESEGSSYKVKVTAGAINSIVKIEDIYDVTDGDVVYIHVTIDGDGLVTDVAVGVASELPADGSLDGYTLLATCEVVTPEGGTAYLEVTPVAWNYSQLQVCGSVADEGDVTVFLWGGFGE